MVWLYMQKRKAFILMRESFETNVLNGGSPIAIDEK